MQKGINNASESEKLETTTMETLYLFGSPCNASHLIRSIEQAERGEFVDVDLNNNEVDSSIQIKRRAAAERSE